jgi:hypothetical protein
MAKDSPKKGLSAHPRLAGALFTGLLLLAQAGSALAGHSTGYPGP